MPTLDKARQLRGYAAAADAALRDAERREAAACLDASQSATLMQRQVRLLAETLENAYRRHLREAQESALVAAREEVGAPSQRSARGEEARTTKVLEVASRVLPELRRARAELDMALSAQRRLAAKAARTEKRAAEAQAAAAAAVEAATAKCEDAEADVAAMRLQVEAAQAEVARLHERQEHSPPPPPRTCAAPGEAEATRHRSRDGGIHPTSTVRQGGSCPGEAASLSHLAERLGGNFNEIWRAPPPSQGQGDDLLMRSWSQPALPTRPSSSSTLVSPLAGSPTASWRAERQGSAAPPWSQGRDRAKARPSTTAGTGRALTELDRPKSRGPGFAARPATASHAACRERRLRSSASGSLQHWPSTPSLQNPVRGGGWKMTTSRGATERFFVPQSPALLLGRTVIGAGTWPALAEAWR